MLATKVIYLPARPPFRLDATVRALQRRPTNRVDLLSDGRYQRLISAPEGEVLVTAEEQGTPGRPEVKLTLLGRSLSASIADHLSQTVQRMLGLAVDLDPFYALIQSEPALARLVPRLRGLKPPRFPTLFEAFVNAIAFQQISLDAGVAIVGRFVQRFGPSLNIDGRPYYAFPGPGPVAAAEPMEMRRLGFTMRKGGYIQGIARRLLAGEMTPATLESLPSAEATKLLQQLPGIGRWSAELVLLRGLGRLDVFPIGDVGARGNLAKLLGFGSTLTVEQEQRILAPLGDYKGCLYFYLLGWRLIDLGLLQPTP